MGVVQDRQRKSGSVTPARRIETQKSFHDIPAIVDGPASIRRLRNVYFFAQTFADVANVEVAGCAIERKTVGVPQAVAPHGEISACKYIAIIADEVAGIASQRIEPQHFPQKYGLGLGIVWGVAATSAI